MEAGWFEGVKIIEHDAKLNLAARTLRRTRLLPEPMRSRLQIGKHNVT